MCYSKGNYSNRNGFRCIPKAGHCSCHKEEREKKMHKKFKMTLFFKKSKPYNFHFIRSPSKHFGIVRYVDYRCFEYCHSVRWVNEADNRRNRRNVRRQLYASVLPKNKNQRVSLIQSTRHRLGKSVAQLQMLPISSWAK